MKHVAGLTEDYLERVVRATKSIAEMPVVAIVVTGCGKGLERYKLAIRITRRMIPCDNCSIALTNPADLVDPKRE
jgi:hypothetical protein